MNVSSPLWLEIDLNAVQNNCIHILRDTQTPLMAIVKADAYGHGAAEVAQAAVKGGAAWLGVARFGEARELRQHGIRAPILVLGAATSNEVDEAIACDVALALYSFETLELYAARARRASLPLKVHLKIETGMGRLGVFPEDAAAFTRRLRAEKNILIDGVFSHLAAAEEADNLLNALQLQRFQSALDALKEMGMLPRWIHLANSAAAFYLPQSRFNLIRVGNVMLGLRIRIDEPLPAHYK
ncbi:MAG: alanine racemase, partial [Chloroflexi bacterium]|nr:alanine racemase [Chloroflexota bacterium]